MDIIVDAQLLKQALKRLQPRSKYKSMQESLVSLAAGGSSLILVGTLESSASIEAEVRQAGSTTIPLAMAIKLLGTYGKGSRIVVRSEPDAVVLDKVRISLG